MKGVKSNLLARTFLAIGRWREGDEAAGVLLPLILELSEVCCS